ncbi:AMP-binding protein [Chloroflexota bacterium]
MKSYDNPWIMSFDEVLSLGLEYEREHPTHFEENIKKTAPDDICILYYTAGTTGTPKGIMRSYEDVILNTCAWHLGTWR